MVGARLGSCRSAAVPRLELQLHAMMLEVLPRIIGFNNLLCDIKATRIRLNVIMGNECFINRPPYS